MVILSNADYTSNHINSNNSGNSGIANNILTHSNDWILFLENLFSCLGKN